MRVREKRIKRGNTDAAYIDLLPLRHVSDQSGETKEADEGEELRQPQDPEGAASVQNLETFAEILPERKQREGGRLNTGKDK